MSKYQSKPHDVSGMPPGIPYIIGNEAAERFSFYGMKAILVVFMTKHLLDAGGNLDGMNEEQAKGVYHLFTAAAYFFPLIGSIIADVVLGKYRTILYLSLLYCLGHACLAVMDIAPHYLGMGMEPWLYAGLLFIAMGAGAIKPCVSAHVGDQFGPKNRQLVSKTFGWFYFSINTGAFASTMLTPVFLNEVGPWLAFGVPGVLMAIATFVFWLGRNRFVHVPPAGGKKFVEETFSKEGVRALINLSPIFLIFIPAFWAIFDQTGSAWVLQAEGMDRKLGIEWLPSQIQAVNPLLILILIPVFTYVIYPTVNKVVKVTPLRKIGFGLFVTAGAFGLSALIETNINGGFVVQSSSQSEVKGWARERLIDGEADGNGWSSKLRPTDQEHDPEAIVVRLRERELWTVDGVEVNPYAEKGERPKGVEPEGWEPDAPDLENFARAVTVYARNARDTTQYDDEKEPIWTEVGSTELAQENRLQAIRFDPVEATHIKFEFASNWGGDRIKAGHVTVLASGEGTPTTTGVWPDVAAAGRKPNIGWQFLAYMLLTAAEVMVSITSLEFAYTQAPRKMKSFIMGIYFLGVSLGNFFTAGVNFVLDQMRNEDGSSKLEGADYYWFFTALMVVTSVFFIFVAMRYKGETYIQGDDEPDDEKAEAEAEAPDAR